MKANKGGLAQLIATDSNVLLATAAVTLRLDQRHVHADSTGGAFAITLPPVNEACGMIFTVYFDVDGGDVTVQDQNESDGWADVVMTAVDDQLAVLSDGRHWIKLIEVST